MKGCVMWNLFERFEPGTTRSVLGLLTIRYRVFKLDSKIHQDRAIENRDAYQP